METTLTLTEAIKAHHACTFYLERDDDMGGSARFKFLVAMLRRKLAPIAQSADEATKPPAELAALQGKKMSELTPAQRTTLVRHAHDAEAALRETCRVDVEPVPLHLVPDRLPPFVVDALLPFISQLGK